MRNNRVSKHDDLQIKEIALQQQKQNYKKKIAILTNNVCLAINIRIIYQNILMSYTLTSCKYKITIMYTNVINILQY